ncbi:hypothetical protein BRD04_04680 [Halobacteriales archaeon QS_9_67_17]|nr:MAG: hypothetical protein BRD04_04680 [Halobacteriales archaeon QS_9_67_17]
MSEEDLREAADALRGSVVVAGCGEVGREAAAQVAVEGVVARADDVVPDDARAAFVGVDLADPSPAVALARRCAAADTLAVLVAAVDPRPTAEARTALATLREAADAVVLSAGEEPVAGTAAGLRTLVRLIAGSDDVNVDLADAETVVATGGFAAVGAATDPDPAAAMTAAVDACGPVSLTRASGALVHLEGERELSVQAAGDAVAAVRDRLVDGSHVIWGADTDADEHREGRAHDGEVTARVVLAGVVPVRPPAEAGDPCPRCGAALVGYRMGDRETVACDGCGFADVTTPLGGDPLVPGEDYGSGSGS